MCDLVHSPGHFEVISSLKTFEDNTLRNGPPSLVLTLLSRRKAGPAGPSRRRTDRRRSTGAGAPGTGPRGPPFTPEADRAPSASPLSSPKDAGGGAPGFGAAVGSGSVRGQGVAPSRPLTARLPLGWGAAAAPRPGPSAGRSPVGPGASSPAFSLLPSSGRTLACAAAPEGSSELSHLREIPQRRLALLQNWF